MVLDVEVVVDGDLVVLVLVRLGQRQHERLVLVRREVVAREEVQHDLRFRSIKTCPILIIQSASHLQLTLISMMG